MKFSTMTFYKNTPFQSLNESILFKSEKSRDTFIDKYEQIQKDFSYNFVRDRLDLEVSISFIEAQSINLVRALNPLSDNKRLMYFQVSDRKYINDGTTRLTLVPDLILTYCFRDVISENAKNVYVEREHLTKKTYQDNLYKLSTNTDVLNTSEPVIIKKEFYSFSKNNIVIFTTSGDLESDFGNEDNAKFSTSRGGNYDNLVSPLNLYAMQKEDFVKFQDYMKNFSWVGRTISNVNLVPLEMVDLASDFTKISVNKEKDLNVYKANNGAHSSNVYFETLKKSITELKKMIDIDDSYQHMLRKTYLNIRLSLNTGAYIDIDPSKLPEKGLDIILQQVLGYTNSFVIYPSEYQTKASKEQLPKGLDVGLQYENALEFSNFSTIPTIVDNYNLALASSSHMRSYENSNTLKGQANRVKSSFDNVYSDIKNNGFQFENIGNYASQSIDGIVAGIQGLSGMTSIQGIAGKFTNDYEYYRRQRAQFADMALTPPSVADMPAGVNFGLANGTFGLQVSYHSISKQDLENIKNYHAKFGLEINTYKSVDPLDTMNKANYIKFSGNWFIPDVPSEYMKIIKSLFENGVLYYHENYANEIDNPFNTPLKNNERIK